LHDRGGLWGCSAQVEQLLEDAQHCFNNIVGKNTKSICVDEIMETINFQRFVNFEISFSDNVKLQVAEKLTKLYLTAISFGYAKKIPRSILIPSKHRLRTHSVQT